MKLFGLLVFLGCFSSFVFSDWCTVLDPGTIEKYVQDLPLPPTAIPSGTVNIQGNEIPHYIVEMIEGKHRFHPSLGESNIYGYNGTYPGPLFDFRKDEEVLISWINLLPKQLEDHIFPVDYSLLDTNRKNIGIYSVPHLHGSHSASQYDGLPEDYIRPGQVYNAIYDHSQNATQLWYHDHGLGITRLNAYAGLVGTYFIRDDVEDSLNLPSGDHEIPLVLGDRALCTNGTAFYPETPQDQYMQNAPRPHKNFYVRDGNSPDPSVVPEFFGNNLEVNGALWPKLVVQRNQYRFRVLAGTNARTFILSLQNSDGKQYTFTLIGSDGGLLPSPTQLSEIRIMGGERADILIDFAEFGDEEELYLINTGPDSPWQSDPSIPPANSSTTGQVLKFELEGVASGKLDLNWTTVPGPVDFCATTVPEENHFQTNLYENYDQWGRNWLQLDNLNYSSPVTNMIPRNQVVIWDFINHSDDAHPIHLHQVEFQVCGRQSPTGESYPPFAREAGLKDVVECPPGHTTRIAAVFDLLGEYVMHCHMLEHEDYDMMRPIVVVDAE